MGNGTPSSKPEYPPLLAVGFHELSLAELRRLCVEPFPLSKTRGKLADEFEKVAERVRAVNLVCDFWVNGSFLTKKIGPSDVDFIVRFDGAVIDAANDEQNAVIDFLQSDLSSIGCHSFVHVEFPKGHSQHWVGVWMQAYWLKQWGFARDEEMKGIAVIKILGATA